MAAVTLLGMLCMYVSNTVISFGIKVRGEKEYNHVNLIHYYMYIYSIYLYVYIHIYIIIIIDIGCFQQDRVVFFFSSC